MRSRKTVGFGLFAGFGLLVWVSAVMGEPSFLPYASKLKDKDIPVSPQPVMRHELNDATEQQGLGLLEQNNTAHGAMNDGQTFFVLDHLEGIKFPHADWAKPYAGGPIKVLVIAETPVAYDIVQLEQRLDGTVNIALADFSTAGSNPGGNFGHMNPGHAELYEKLILKRLKDHNPDVILVDERVKPVLRRPAVAKEIARRVKNGMGVVAIMGRKFDALYGGGIPNVEGEMIPGLIPFDSKRDLLSYNKPWLPTGEAHPAWSGVAWRALPPMVQLYKTRGKDIPGWQTRATIGNTPILLTSEQGKGRLAAFVSVANLGEVIFPDVGMFGKGTSAQKARVMDDLAGFYIKMLLWAAQRDTGLLFNVECPETVEPLKELPVRVAVFKNSKEFKCMLNVTVQNERRESIYSIQKQVTLTPDGESLLAIPPLKCKGRYYIDVVARDTAGKSLWWAGNAVDVNQGLALDIRIEKDILQPGEPLTGKVISQGDLAPYLPLTRVIELWDSFGRLLYQNKKAVGQTADTSFSFDLAYCPARMLAIVARLESSDRTSAYAEKEATIPVYGVGNDWHTTMWLSHSFDMNTHMNILRRYGFDSILTGPGYYCARYSHAAAWNNMSPVIENAGGSAVCIGGGGCGGSPEGHADWWPGNKKYDQMTETALDAAKALKRYGCLMLSLSNEQEPYQKVLPGKPLEDFRKYLQSEYGGDLAKLNAEWDTTFSSWESVVPSPSKPAKLNFAPELEQQQFMRKTSAREQKRIVDVYFNEWGQSVPWGTTSSGFSLYQAELGSSLYSAGKGYEIGHDIWNNATFAEYLGFEHPEKQYYTLPWRFLFCGSHTVGYYLSMGVVPNFMAFHRRGLWTQKHEREIREGAGKLLVTSELQRDPLAVLYEENTQFTDYKSWGLVSLFAGKDDMDVQSYCRYAKASRDSIWQLLRDSQVRPRAVTENQIQKGLLKNTKILFLTVAACLSDETAKAIEAWVNKGGLLVADMMPGAFDEHGKLRKTGALDHLFGIERTEFKVVHYPPEYTVGILKSAPGFLERLGIEWFYVHLHDGGIKVKDGIALGQHYVKGKAPAFIYKKNGKGAALYLNFLDTEYIHTRDPRHLRFMKELLSDGGIKPCVRLLDPVTRDIKSGFEITRFTDDQAMHIGVFGGDGEDTVIGLNEEAYIYDVRRHELLGKGKEARTIFTKSYPRLISCLPCRIDGVKIEMPGSVKRGDLVKFNVGAILEGKPTSLVYRLEFLNPEGDRANAYFSKVRAPGGRYAGAVQFALNDKPGKWTLKATEIVSGKSTAYTFKVK